MSNAINRLREVGEYLVLQADLTVAYRTATGLKPGYDCSDLGAASPSVLSWARKLGNQLIEDADRYAEQEATNGVDR